MTKVYEKNGSKFRLFNGHLQYMGQTQWLYTSRGSWPKRYGKVIQDCLDQKEDSHYLVKEEER